MTNDAEHASEPDGARAADDASAAFWVNEPADVPLKLPARVGSYRILEVIGSGGMGVVYRAEQKNPRRTVALKVIRAGLTSPEMLRRFKDEAQLLGRLHHPGIAQIYEAGAANGDEDHDSQPFIAMELIEGQSITGFARDSALGTRRRLELMTEVCDAVHHAHQKGVIHRDLKPGNILVDRAGQPKVVDFGVARMTDADLQVTTMGTSVGQLIGTLPYMSPEQIAADPLRLDTRSDVYALGVVLYELLAERLPYDLQNKTVPEAARMIDEADPTPLSSVDRLWRGDVETIVSKALEKDKDRRYGSASELAEDIRRYLRNEPIAARPASAVYHLRKFARRHRALVIATATVIVVPLVGITGTTIAWVRASHAQRLAEQRRRDAEQSAQIAAAVNDFLNNDLLASVSPDESGRDTTVKEVLDRASVSIEDRFQDAPPIEAAIRMTLGTAYHKLGQYSEAEAHMRRAVELREALHGPADPRSLESKIATAELLIDLGRFDESERMLDEVETKFSQDDSADRLRARAQIALGSLRTAQGRYAEAVRLIGQGTQQLMTALDEDHRDVLAARTSLARAKTFLGRYREAERLYEQILSTQRETLGNAHPDAIVTTNLLASIYLRQEKNERALQLLEETHQATIEKLGEDHPEAISLLNNMAAANKMLGNYATAEPMYLRAIDLCERNLPPDHPVRMTALNNLARLYFAQRKFDKAEPVYLDALKRRRELLGADHPDTCGVEENLAAMYAKMGRVEEAQRLVEHVLEARLAELGKGHRETIYSMFQLATLLYRQQQYETAEVRFRDAVDNARRSLGKGNPWIGKYMVGHGYALTKLERYEEAERVFRAGHDILLAALGPDDNQTMLAVRGLVELFEQTDRATEAEEWRQHLVESPAQ